MTNSSTKKPTKTNPKSTKKPPNENSVEILEIDRLLTIVKVKPPEENKEKRRSRPAERFTKIGKCLHSGACGS